MKCPRCEAENPESSRFCGNCATPLRQPEEPSPSRTQTFEGFPMDLERGSLFAGRYEVIEELGSGGMGKVYKAYDQKIQETIALKLIRPELALRPKTLDRFREEIRLARKITHKNVCRMHDLNEEKGVPYITMEYVAGEDLKSIIRMMGRLSPAQAVFIGKQVSTGLAEAHKLGIIHRDLKPKNIMIDREGNARIMDFGLARSLEEKGITAGRTMVGTAEYMSPEQVEGKKADGRSDLYSLGVILFEMVTGRLPFEGDSALSIAVKHKTEPPPDPRNFNLQIPEALSQMILKCLEKSPEKRYPTTADLLAELDRLEKEFPSAERILPQKKPSTLREIVGPLRTKKILLPLLGVLVLLVAAVIAGKLLRHKHLLSIPSGKPSLAVLHFKNNTGDKELDVWQEALAENLISELRRSSPNLTVLSIDIIRTVLHKLNLREALSYTSEDLNAVASATKVSYIVVGSYFKANINYEIKASRKNENLGEGQVQGNLDEEYGRMTGDLAKQILASLNLPARPREAKAPTPSNLAYRYYQLGLQAERRYKDSENAKDFDEAVAYHSRALAEDPHFSQAYWGLGDIYQVRYVGTKKTEDLALMIYYYEKSYEADPQLAGGNVGLGWAYFFKGDNDRAYQYFKRAYELEPESPAINHAVAGFFRSVGLNDRAIKYYSAAITLGEPMLMNYWLRASCYERVGRLAEAVADARTVAEMEPQNVRNRLFYARMLIIDGKLGEGEKEIARAEAADPGHSDIRPTKALLLAARGDGKGALPLLAEAEKDPVFFSYLISRVYAVSGLEEQAIANIELGIEKGFSEAHDYLYDYPFLKACRFYDSLRSHPRFQEILERQKEQYLDRLNKYPGL